MLVRVVEIDVLSQQMPTSPPEGFGTMCNGDALEPEDLRIMPMASMLSNFDLAIANLSGSRRWAWAWTGAPLVGIKCPAPCLEDE